LYANRSSFRFLNGFDQGSVGAVTHNALSVA
jgi:hypothetical protein